MSDGMVTVHLSQPVATGDKDWARGYVEKHNEVGVWISTTRYGGAQRYFFPAHLIQRVEYT